MHNPEFDHVVARAGASAAQTVNFILAVESGEAILVEDRELRHRGLPVLGRTKPGRDVRAAHLTLPRRNDQDQSVD
jgi:hypothetical protein